MVLFLYCDPDDTRVEQATLQFYEESRVASRNERASEPRGSLARSGCRPHESRLSRPKRRFRGLTFAKP